jgi:phosphate acetyltransferase
MGVLQELKRVRSEKTILFDEPQDKRVIRAIKELKKKKVCNPVIVAKKVKKYPVEAIIVGEDKRLINYTRKKLKCTIKKAKELLSETNWYATALVATNKADGYISGAINPTKRTLLPALKLLARGYASSYFIMINKRKTWYFADCALNISPNERQIAKIANDTARNAIKFGTAPKVALLSFSTAGSASHDSVLKMRKAAQYTNTKLKGTGSIVEGEVQFDAAIDKKVAINKNPHGKLLGSANVFIFPDLNAANIGYKIAQRVGDFQAIGPIVQGLRKPVNDLSRGCTVDEIILTTAIMVKE